MTSLAVGGEKSTPKSEAAIALFSEFARRIEERLENGRRVYGDSSFDRPLESLVEEIRQELLDVAGWSFIMYHRLSEIEKRIKL